MDVVAAVVVVAVEEVEAIVDAVEEGVVPSEVDQAEAVVDAVVQLVMSLCLLPSARSPQ